jgi:glycine/D-amino acid oxidase-like deaminating enzyme
MMKEKCLIKKHFDVIIIGGGIIGSSVAYFLAAQKEFHGSILVVEKDLFIFANGFSGHGLQQAPAVGRAVSELITFGLYKTLDLSIFKYDRFQSGRLVKELNVV